MTRYESIRAVKEAIHGETYSGNVDVEVQRNGNIYFYNDIYLRVSYKACYGQLDVYICWEDDVDMVDYKSLNLHGEYNTNFQDFEFKDNILSWEDGINHIEIRF